MRIAEYLKIIRPFNFLFVLLAVLFGAYYQTQFSLSLKPILAAFSAAFICSSGYIINDIYDIEIDKTNKPDRPLPAGEISISSARTLAILLFVFGFLLALYLQNLPMIMLALFNAVILWFYAKKSKRLLFWANLIVAFTSASTFIYGGLVNDNFGNSLFVFVVALLYTLIRELVKDVEDVKGDGKQNAKTVPLVYGRQKALILSLFLAVILNLVFLYGYISMFYNLFFLLLILMLVGLFVMGNLIFLYYKKEKKFAFFSEIIMKINMLMFLIILWVSQ